MSEHDINFFVRLQEELIQHAHLYYALDEPTIPDEEYDQLFRLAIELGEKYPIAINAKCPTQQVGGKLKAYLDPVKHTHPMLSLDNLFNKEELTSWIENNPECTYYLDVKFDGLAISLIYTNGHLTEALTRGTGGMGENVIHTMKLVHNVPSYIVGLAHLERFEVRGEVVMLKTAFDRYNREQIAKGKKPLVNCRNGIAGAIRTLDTKAVRERGAMFFAYGAPEHDFDSHSKAMDFLKQQGFGVGWNSTIKTNTIEEIQVEYEKLIARRGKLAYDIDGMVIKVDDMETQEELGFLSRVPNWAIAYKFPADKQWTDLEDIGYQVGRTGVITPVGKLKTVFVGGANFNNVTLHNADEIKRLGLKKGCRVLLERRGDVIPKIMEVEGGEEPYVFIKECPVCEHKLQRSHVAILCPNPSCSAQLVTSLNHFASRLAMNIRDLSGKRIEVLIEQGLIKDFVDILLLDEETLMKAGFGKKMSVKIYANIVKAKEVELNRFIFGLGIKEVGESTAMLLASQYRSIESLSKANKSDLMDLPDVGEVTATSVVNFFSNTSNKERLSIALDSEQGGIVFKKPSMSEDQRFVGKNIVVTGSFDSYKREDLKQLVRSMGGNVKGSVSNNTDYLIAGKNPGSKLAAAQELDLITIIYEDGIDEFFA